LQLSRRSRSRPKNCASHIAISALLTLNYPTSREKMKNNPAQNIVREVVPSYGTTSKVLLVGSILSIGIVGANPAHAASLVNGTGISNPATTITFDEIPLAGDTALTNQYSSLGVTFTGLFFDTTDGFFGFPNIIGNAAANFPQSTFTVTNPFTIRFAQSQSQAAFSLVTNTGSSTFEALLNGSVVDSFSSTTDISITNNFYGFTGVTFDSIRVTAGGFNEAAALDNIQFSSAAQSVPEPFTIIGTLVGGTAAVRMRKKLKSADKG
jgi:hypothetical protein